VLNPLLFLCSGKLETAVGTRDLRDMVGRGRQLPITSATCLIGSLSLAGIPPLNGFWSKLIIVLVGIQTGHTPWAVTVVVISIVALAYQLKVQQQAFYSDAESTADERLSAGGQPQRIPESLFATVPLILLAIGCVGTALLALPGLEHPLLIGPAADALMRGVWTP
jgi:multicomponent Na+:H+ antiporter subunit D